MSEQMELKPEQANPAQDERKGGTSASSAPYDDLCPGRHLAQRNIPETKGDKDATFGTNVHNALAKNDPTGLDTQEENIFDACQEIEAKLIQQVFGPEANHIRSFREQRLWCKVKAAKGDERYLHSGKPDVVHRVGPTLLIIEYKALPGEHQSSPENLQLRDQAVLAARTYLAKEVLTAVVQPLITHSPELCRYDEVSINQAEEDMFKRVRASNDPKSPRIPGNSQCKFCRAAPACKEYTAYASAALPLALPQRPDWEVVMSEWTPEQKARVAESLPALKKLIKDAEASIKESLRADAQSVPGFLLEEGNTRTIVNDPEQLFTRFVELGGTLDQFMKCVSITKKELEAQLRAITKKKGKGLAAEIEKILEGIVDCKQNESSIGKVKS